MTCRGLVFACVAWRRAALARPAACGACIDDKVASSTTMRWSRAPAPMAMRWRSSRSRARSFAAERGDARRDAAQGARRDPGRAPSGSGRVGRDAALSFAYDPSRISAEAAQRELRLKLQPSRLGVAHLRNALRRARSGPARSRPAGPGEDRDAGEHEDHERRAPQGRPDSSGQRCIGVWKRKKDPGERARRAPAARRGLKLPHDMAALGAGPQAGAGRHRRRLGLAAAAGIGRVRVLRGRAPLSSVVSAGLRSAATVFQAQGRRPSGRPRVACGVQGEAAERADALWARPAMLERIIQRGRYRRAAPLDPGRAARAGRALASNAARSDHQHASVERVSRSVPGRTRRRRSTAAK